MTPGSYRVCNEPGCGALVPAGAGKCSRHRSEARRRSDAKRPTATQRGYGSTTGWRAIRRRYLAAHALCECDDCLARPEHERPAATDVDHIDGTGPYGDNTDGNLRAMAHAHHSRRTARDHGFGARPLAPERRGR